MLPLALVAVSVLEDLFTYSMFLASQPLTFVDVSLFVKKYTSAFRFRIYFWGVCFIIRILRLNRNQLFWASKLAFPSIKGGVYAEVLGIKLLGHEVVEVLQGNRLMRMMIRLTAAMRQVVLGTNASQLVRTIWFLVFHFVIHFGCVNVEGGTWIELGIGLLMGFNGDL